MKITSEAPHTNGSGLFTQRAVIEVDTQRELGEVFRLLQRAETRHRFFVDTKLHVMDGGYQVDTLFTAVSAPETRKHSNPQQHVENLLSEMEKPEKERGRA